MSHDDLVAGLRASVPVVLGYIPACLTFGVVGVGLGVPAIAVFALSALVYAGASQFVAVKLLAAGTSAPVIAGTVALVNARYLLLARAFRNSLPPRGRRGRALAVAALLTEEVYAVAQYSKRRSERDRLTWSYLAGLEVPPYLITLACTAAGTVVAHSVPSEVLPSLNTSLYALLLALVLPQIVASSRVALMCAAAVATSVIVTVLAGSTPAVLASAAVGFVVLNLTRRYGRPAAPTARATPAGSAAPTTPDSSGAPTSSSASGAPDSFTREADSETGVHP